MSRGSYYSDDESFLSYNNNCSSGTSDRNWSVDDRSWSVEDINWSATKSVTLGKPTTSSPRQSSKRNAARRDTKPKTGSSPPPNKRKKGKKQLQTGFIAFVKRLAKSDPSEHQLLKAALGFPIGLVVAAGLFFVVILPMDLDPDVRNLVGSLVGLVLAIGFAFSVQVGLLKLHVQGNNVTPLAPTHPPRTRHPPTTTTT